MDEILQRMLTVEEQAREQVRDAEREAEQILERNRREIADLEQQTSAESAAAVLDAVHVASPNGSTVMSVLGDLPRGLVYVYLMHQFDAPLVLSVQHEIARNPKPGPLEDLFPEKTVLRAGQVHDRIMARAGRCGAAGWTWAGLVAGSLILMLAAVRPRKRGLPFWVALVAILGPAGLAVRLAAAKGKAGVPSWRWPEILRLRWWAWYWLSSWQFGCPR